MNKRPFRERLAQFLYGRNGVDYLNKYLLGFCVFLLLLNAFVQSWIVYLLELGVLSYYTFRAFSKNITKRQAENIAFFNFIKKFKSFFILQKNKIRDWKTHVYCKCKMCGNTLRLPRISGEHTVVCPCCHAKFDIKL